MKSGIYIIENVRNGHIYVGQSTDIRARWSGHKSKLIRGKSSCYALQNAWNKYGADSFAFKQIISCAQVNLNMYENLAITALKPDYNMMPANPSIDGGSAVSQAAREKIARSRLGKKRPKHVCEAVAKANRERVLSEDARKKLRERKTREFTKESIEMMRARMVGALNPMYGKGMKGADHPSFGKPSANRIQVINLSTGVVYESIKAASVDAGVSGPTLGTALKYNGGRVRNSVWAYKQKEMK